ncbi:MAG: hypothetical protein LBR78_02970 [Holosporales bacterium]|jgi:hypothetical protein|nr:hypothetical protein [Holosporales bacterium]
MKLFLVMVCVLMTIAEARTSETPAIVETVEGQATSAETLFYQNGYVRGMRKMLKLREKHWLLTDAYGSRSFLGYGAVRLLSPEGLKYELPLYGNREWATGIKIHGYVGVGAMCSRRCVPQAGMRTNTVTFMRVDIMHKESGAGISGEISCRFIHWHSTRSKRIRRPYSVSLRGSYKF